MATSTCNVVDPDGRIMCVLPPAHDGHHYADGAQWVISKASEAKGKKDDAGKLRWWLVPVKPMEAIVRALMNGAEKYGVDNYLLVENAQERYYDAAMRHLTAWRAGETHDKDTGNYHLAHAGACLLILLALEMKE